MSKLQTIQENLAVNYCRVAALNACSEKGQISQKNKNRKDPEYEPATSTSHRTVLIPKLNFSSIIRINHKLKQFIGTKGLTGMNI